MSALRRCFREVSDRAHRKMVCSRHAFSHVWTIVRACGRRDAESLYDRARSGRLRALIFGALAFLFELVARVGRARVFRRPSRAYTLRAAWLRHASLATPETAASTPSRSLPSQPHSRQGVCADALANRAVTRGRTACSIDAPSKTPLDRHPLPGGRARPKLERVRDPTASRVGYSWGGRERSARRSVLA